MRFLDHTEWHITVGRTPPDERSAHLRDSHVTTHNTQQTNIHAPGRIRTCNPSKQTLALDLSTTGIGTFISLWVINNNSGNAHTSGACKKLRKATISFVVCPYVSLHGIAGLSLDTFSLNLIFEDIWKVCR